MQESNLFGVFLSRLETSGLQYMVTGAAASIIYGEPRLTHDIDLVVEMREADAGQIVHAFPLDMKTLLEKMEEYGLTKEWEKVQQVQ